VCEKLEEREEKRLTCEKLEEKEKRKEF